MIVFDQCPRCQQDWTQGIACDNCETLFDSIRGWLIYPNFRKMGDGLFWLYYGSIEDVRCVYANEFDDYEHDIDLPILPYEITVDRLNLYLLMG